MIKRIPTGFNTYTRKNKRCYISLPIPFIGFSLVRGHQIITIMNLNMLFLNSPVKDRDTTGISYHPALKNVDKVCFDFVLASKTYH